jgi:hypothetical protein
VVAGNPVAVGVANAPGAAATTVHSDHVHAGLTRGAADFTVFANKAAVVGADVLLVEDSAAAGAKKNVTVAGMFGGGYATALSAARSTTLNAAFQAKTTLVSAALTGTYRVSWMAVVDAAAEFEVEAQLYNSTDVAVVGAAQRSWVKMAAERVHVGGFAEVVFAGVAKTFVVQYRSVGGVTVGIQDARIELWRVA